MSGVNAGADAAADDRVADGADGGRRGVRADQ
jgi:hypothetical protein